MREQYSNDRSYNEAIQQVAEAAIAETGVIFQQGVRGDYQEHPISLRKESVTALRMRLHNGFLEYFRVVDRDTGGNDSISQQVLHEDSTYQQLNVKLENSLLDRSASQVTLYVTAREVDDLNHVIAQEHRRELEEMGRGNSLKRAQLLEEVGAVYDVIEEFDKAVLGYDTVYRDHFQDEIAILADPQMTLNDFLQDLHAAHTSEEFK